LIVVDQHGETSKAVAVGCDLDGAIGVHVGQRDAPAPDGAALDVGDDG
jgi:hypothetical protein